MEKEPVESLSSITAEKSQGFPSISLLQRLYAAGALAALALGFVPNLAKAPSKLCFFLSCLLAVCGGLITWIDELDRRSGDD